MMFDTGAIYSSIYATQERFRAANIPAFIRIRTGCLLSAGLRAWSEVDRLLYLQMRSATQDALTDCLTISPLQTSLSPLARAENNPNPSPGTSHESLFGMFCLFSIRSFDRGASRAPNTRGPGLRRGAQS